MEFEKLAAEKRYSCRNFEQRPIEKTDMDKILEAGRIAPTAGNFQPQRVIAINTPEGMTKLTQCTHYTYGAPAALIVCYNSDEVWVRNYDGKNSGDVDASIVTTQMMLQAAELGIGTCWVGHFDPWKIKELMDSCTLWKVSQTIRHIVLSFLLFRHKLFITAFHNCTMICVRRLPRTNIS